MPRPCRGSIIRFAIRRSAWIEPETICVTAELGEPTTDLGSGAFDDRLVGRGKAWRVPPVAPARLAAERGLDVPAESREVLGSYPTLNMLMHRRGDPAQLVETDDVWAAPRRCSR